MSRLVLTLSLLLGVAACSAPAPPQTSAPAPATEGSTSHGERPDPTPSVAPPTGHSEHLPDATTQPRSSRGSRATRLVAATRTSLRRWRDVADAEAAGFRSLGDDEDRYVHYMNTGWMLDGKVLHARRPESLVYEKTDGGRTLVSAMYVLPIGTAMTDVPDLGDARVRWHTHDNLCFSTDGTLAGHLVDGECSPGGINVRTPPMLHVWIVDHPCGPFADLGGGRCKHGH